MHMKPMKKKMFSRMSMVGTLLESSYFVSPTPSPDRRFPANSETIRVEFRHPK